MKPFLKRDVRSVIFVVTLLTAGAGIAYVVVTNLEPKAFWGMMINIFVCLSTSISAGIDIYKIRKKEEQEREENRNTICN